MALIEATADYFNELSKLISDQTSPLKNTLQYLRDKYSEVVGQPPGNGDTPLDGLILDRYAVGVDPADISEWVSTREWIGERIAEHAVLHPVFTLPTIFMIYFKVGTEPMTASVNCPIPDHNLQLIYSDLGISIYG